MLVGDSLKPLSDVSSVELMFALVCLLLLEGGRFVEDNLALLRPAMHADSSLLTGAFLLYLLDYGLEFSGPNSVLNHDIMHAVPIVILLRFLRI